MADKDKALDELGGDSSSVTKRRVMLIAAAMFLASAWALAAVYALHTASIVDAISLPFENRSVTQSLTPEGWAFFTRNPRKKKIFVFVRTGGQWKPAHIGANGRGVLGFDRSGRRGVDESDELFANFGDAPFTRCRGPITDCLWDNNQMPKIRNSFPRPLLCNNIALVTIAPLPWAWSSLKPAVYMPSEIRFMNVIC